jgi:hypothetical protein
MIKDGALCRQGKESEKKGGDTRVAGAIRARFTSLDEFLILPDWRRALATGYVPFSQEATSHTSPAIVQWQQQN